MTVLDAFAFSQKTWDAIEDKYEMAHKAAVSAAKTDLDFPAALMVELLQGMAPKEKEALALGVVVGRASRGGMP